ncbi:MAG: ABC transporter substrate-binding protein [Candidatus Binatia bacterium]
MFVFLPLVTYDGYYGGAVPQPGLAQRWEHSPDYRTWTFYLRRDVKWHDGVPVTAHDMKFTMDLWADPDVMHWAASDVESVTVLDDYTFRVVHKRPSRNDIDGWNVYYPKHLLDNLNPNEFWKWEFWTHPMGNGPYRFVRSLAKTMMEFEANPDYYKGKPKIDRVVLKFGGGTQLTELLSGNVDIITNVTGENIRQVAKDRRFRMYYNLAPSRFQIFWNHRHSLFRDRVVRRALTLAINRRELHDLLNFPKNIPLFDGICTARQFRQSECGEALPYDPELAKRLLDNAGWRDKDEDGVRERDGEVFRFTLMVPRGRLEQAAIYIQEQLRRVGLHMEVQTLERTVPRQRLLAGEFEAAINMMGGTPGQHKVFFGQKSRIGYDKPRVTELFDAAEVAMDLDERDGIYLELGEILRADMPVTFLFPRVMFIVAHRRIQGLESPYRSYPIWMMEHLWLEDED